jgi:hypothetical protein
MMILNSLKMIYIHIHKTGGSSIEFSLSQIAKWNDIIVGSTDFGELIQPMYLSTFGLNKHSPAAEIKSVVGTDVWNSYFVWATVRHPYTRIASLYAYTASLIEPLLPDSSFPRGGGTHDKLFWIENSELTESPWTYPTVKAYLSAYGSERPFSDYLRSPYLTEEPAFQTQSEQLRDSNGKLIVDEFFALERLDRLWPTIIGRFGLTKLPLVRQNVTSSIWKRPFAELFSDEADVQFVRGKFADDFDAFSYDSALFPGQ